MRVLAVKLDKKSDIFTVREKKLNGHEKRLAELEPDPKPVPAAATSTVPPKELEILAIKFIMDPLSP